MKGTYYALGLLLVFGAVFAAAATLNVNGGTIQHGEDVDLTCTAFANVDGWGLETDTNLVSYVRIFYENGHCNGADMFIVITKDGTPIADAKVTLNGTGTTGNVPLTALGFGNTTPAPQTADDITDIEIWIEGPAS